MGHWTDNIDDFIYYLKSDIEDFIKDNFSDENSLPDNWDFTIRSTIEKLKTVGHKVSLVPYKSSRCDAPIPFQVFLECWKRAGEPKDFFDLEDNK